LAQDKQRSLHLGSIPPHHTCPLVPAMPGAVGAIVGARNARRRGGGMSYQPTKLSNADIKRMEAQAKERKRRVQMGKVIKQYDTNKSGKLERDQIIKLLTDMDTSTPPGTAPSDEQVEFLLKVADKQGDGAIEAGELEEVITCWHTFIENKQEWEDKMAKYDVSNTGTLSKEEVKAYLTDVNGGKDVSDEEVDMVMKDADVLGNGTLNKIELQRATAAWYSYVEEKNGCCCVQ